MSWLSFDLRADVLISPSVWDMVLLDRNSRLLCVFHVFEDFSPPFLACVVCGKKCHSIWTQFRPHGKLCFLSHKTSPLSLILCLVNLICLAITLGTYPGWYFWDYWIAHEFQQIPSHHSHFPVLSFSRIPLVGAHGSWKCCCSAHLFLTSTLEWICPIFVLINLQRHCWFCTLCVDVAFCFDSISGYQETHLFI